ncbi:hypothetical protein NPS53_09455 [Pseudomonas putida]|uniref:hypothetical protein n=1 Tax=Pseudomonas putida TaxID=303 RepID=UPI0023636E28|nr:hypothetical protein [Pseudomonas putida]MDD2139803.1 hypothetical protein [Pseudomonas putida]HDS1721727.1 hypothetical protein [Pseudomonas putida]
MLSRAQIEFCIDEEVCCHCGKSIRWGQEAVYTINGAHYQCQFPEGRSKALDTRLSDILGKPLKPGEHAAFGTSSVPVKARANGGHVLHWVVPNTGVALCGRYPAHNAKRMRKRGMWLPLPADTKSQRLKACESCASTYALRAGAQPACVGTPAG